LDTATDKHYCSGIELLHICFPFKMVLESAAKNCAVKTTPAHAEATGPDLALVGAPDIEVVLMAAAHRDTSTGTGIAEAGFRATELLRRH
jgi:hypothetical protein